jgi:hypothetical protein
MQLKIITNKKAQEFFLGPHKTVFYMVMAVIIVVMMLALVFTFTNSNKDLSIIPENLEISLIKYRIINSDCFLLKQEKINGLLTVIDWNKFSQNTMDSCLMADRQGSPQYKLTLSLIENRKIIDKKEIQTKNFIASSKSINTIIPISKDNKPYLGELKIEAK